MLVSTLFTDCILRAMFLLYHYRTLVLDILCVLTAMALFAVTNGITGPLAFLILDEFVRLFSFKGAL